MVSDISEIMKLVKIFEKSQFEFKPNLDFVKKYPIITRQELQKMAMKKGIYSCRSSGSTGEPVIVQKYILDHIWYIATNIRELITNN